MKERQEIAFNIKDKIQSLKKAKDQEKSKRCELDIQINKETLNKFKKNPPTDNEYDNRRTTIGNTGSNNQLNINVNNLEN